jgi:hypothetical protein
MFSNVNAYILLADFKLYFSIPLSLFILQAPATFEHLKAVSHLEQMYEEQQGNAVLGNST